MRPGNKGGASSGSPPALRCRKCGHLHTDEPRTWIALNDTYQHDVREEDRDRPDGNMSLRWTSLPAGHWGELVDEFLKAWRQRDRGNNTNLRKFYQKKLVMPWHEMHAVQKVSRPRMGYAKGELTEGPQIRFLTADWQEGKKNETEHFWWVARAWFENGASRLIDEGRAETKEQLRELQRKYEVDDPCVAIDGGHRLFYIAGICATYEWTVLEGSGQEAFPHRRRKGKRAVDLPPI